MIILALDLSTKSSGWSIFENKKLKKYGCITSTNENIYNRIDTMVSEIKKIIVEYKPTNIMIEDVIPEDVHGNQTVFKALIYLQGFVMHLLNQCGIPQANIKFYTSSEWRKKCGIHTGRGVRRETLKAKDVAFVKSQFDLTVNDDIADAICIGFASVGGEIKKRETIEVDNFGFEFA